MENLFNPPPKRATKGQVSHNSTSHSLLHFIKCTISILIPILLQEGLLTNDTKYPHIVHIERGVTEDANSKPSSAVGTQVLDLEGWFDSYASIINDE